MAQLSKTGPIPPDAVKINANENPLGPCPEAIEAILTSEYPTPAERPLNSRLDTRKLQATFGLILPEWKAGVARMLTEVIGQA